MHRLLDDWLTGYLEYTENTEPPLSFRLWSGIGVISGALQRRCYFKWGHDTFYPNVYIVLVGPSGTARKGVALGSARNFIRAINLSIPANSLSRERLIQYIGSKDVRRTYLSTDGGPVEHSSVMILSPELVVFLKAADIPLLSDLTDWYDSPDDWKYETKHHGHDTLSGVCVSMLGATAPDWLPRILSQEAIGGGWTSRTVFVVETKGGKIVADPDEYTINSGLEKALKHDLQIIYNLRGEYKFGSEARKAYTSWYQRYREDMDQGISPIQDPRFVGFCSRRATHARKIAMLVTASRTNSFTIEEQDWRRAVQLLEDVEARMPQAFLGVGQSKFAEATETLSQYITVCTVQRGGVRRTTLLRRFMTDIDSWTLEQVEKWWAQSKTIEMTLMVNEGGDMFYRATYPMVKKYYPKMSLKDYEALSSDDLEESQAHSPKPEQSQETSNRVVPLRGEKSSS